VEEKIIKANPAGAVALGGQKVVKREVYSASVEARELVELARKEAEGMLERAREEAQRLLNASRDQGYQEGLAHWNETVTRAITARDSFLKESEQELIRLAVRIAEKVIGAELRTDPEAIVNVVREALKSVRRERSLTIQVHPDHVDELRQRLSRLQEAVGAAREILIVGNEKVAVGGCIVESELGTIDARLETQLKCLEEILLRTSRR